MGPSSAQVGQICSFASWYDLQTLSRGESKIQAKPEPICVFRVKLFCDDRRVNHAQSRQSAYSNQLHLNRRIEQHINMICTYFMYCVCLMPRRSHLVASPLIPTALLVIRDRFAFFRSVLPKWTLKSVSRKETSVSGRLSSGMCWTWMEWESALIIRRLKKKRSFNFFFK